MIYFICLELGMQEIAFNITFEPLISTTYVELRGTPKNGDPKTYLRLG
jgi:hypothetical protein